MNFLRPYQNCSGKILVVDDEDLLRWSLTRFLESEGFEAYEAEGGHKALEILESNPIAVLITDLMMPEMSGIELIRIAVDKTPDLFVLVITAADSSQMVTSAQDAGAIKIFSKPLSFSDIVGTINDLLI